MVASYTSNIQITGDWQSIQSGPAFGTVLFETRARGAYFAISDTEPSSDTGHQIYPGKQYEKFLDEGQNLYIRGERDTGVLVYTFTDGNLINGIDQRVYEGGQAITTQGFTEANVKRGSQFYLTNEWTGVPDNGGVVNYIFTTGNQDVLIKDRIVSTTSDNTLYEVFKEPTFTGGTFVPVYNFNDFDPNVTTVTVLKDATVTDYGTSWGNDSMYGSVSSGNRSAGIFEAQGTQRRLKRNTSYAVRITNRSTTNDLDVHVILSWYEGALSIDL